jgi:membrane protease YdiL (CAAX protease family)
MSTSIFISSDESRLRAGWRLLLQTLLLLLFSSALGVLLGLIYYIQPVPLDNFLFKMVISTVIYTGSVFIARRWLDRRSVVSLGLKFNRRAILDLFTGFLIGLAVMGLVFGIAWAANWLTFEGFAWQSDSAGRVLKETLLILLAFVLGGWGEELLIRGYYLQTLESGSNTLWAVLLTSAVFGILHLDNNAASWSSALGTSMLGGLLAYGYVKTRQLWLPIGLHIGWNFCQGAVFGFPVSGIDIYHLMSSVIVGPKLWTGGVFGPEAGLVVIPGILLGLLLVRIHTRLRSSEKGDHESTIGNPAT